MVRGSISLLIFYRNIIFMNRVKLYIIIGGGGRATESFLKNYVFESHCTFNWLRPHLVRNELYQHISATLAATTRNSTDAESMLGHLSDHRIIVPVMSVDLSADLT